MTFMSHIHIWHEKTGTGRYQCQVPTEKGSMIMEKLGQGMKGLKECKGSQIKAKSNGICV